MPSNKSSPSAKSSILRALRARGFYLGSKIGKGSFSSVRLATHIDGKLNETKLACKIVNGQKGTPEFVSKFFPRELKILAQLNHPYVIQVYTILRRDHHYFIFMEYAEGGDLLRYINSTGPLSEQLAKIWFSQLVSALKYLHRNGIAHRDLKCENLLLSSRGHIILTDFGFAKRTVTKGPEAFSTTYCGSSAYAAPEVLLGNPYDPTLADVWSAGVVLFIMLNADMPFDDQNLMRMITCQERRNYVFDAKIESKLTPSARRTVDALLNPLPAQRIQLHELNQLGWVDSRSTPKVVTTTARSGNVHMVLGSLAK